MDSLASGGASGSTTTTPRWWRSRRTAVIAVVAAVAVSAVGLVVREAVRPTPDEVVREFLTAVQRRDVGTALSLVRATDRPAGEEARFLTRDAIADGWQVADVELESPVGRGDRSADVKARLLVGNFVTEGEFRLVDTDDGWRLADPFITYTPEPSPLWYIAVNDVVVARETSDPWALRQSYRLFPGLYQLGRGTSDLVQTTGEAATVLPGVRLELPEVAATAKALPPVQRAVNTLIDECARRSTTANSGCPFGINLFDDALTVAGKYVTTIADVRWKVLRYPAIELDPQPFGHFAIRADKQPGLVQLTATGLDTQGRRIPFTKQCAVTEFPLVAGLTADGTMSVVRPRERYGDAVPAQTTESCLRARA